MNKMELRNDIKDKIAQMTNEEKKYKQNSSIGN